MTGYHHASIQFGNRGGGGKGGPQQPPLQHTQTNSSASTSLGGSGSSIDAKIAELTRNIQVERKVFEGASAMYTRLTDKTAKDQCQSSLIESQKRLEFLESELKRLKLNQGGGGGQGSPQNAPSSPQMPQTRGMSVGKDVGTNSLTPGSNGNLAKLTSFDHCKYSSTITTEKVKFRVKEIQNKLDMEQKVKAGTENLLYALGQSPAGMDPKVAHELRDKMAESNAKISALMKAEHRYKALYVSADSEEAEDGLFDIKTKSTGRLRLKLIGAANLPGKTAIHNEIYATVSIDGAVKATTRSKADRWDENFDIQVDRAQEMEIAVYSKNGSILLALAWFKLVDLEQDLLAKYQVRPNNVNDMEQIWLDLEPAGQLSLKILFNAMGKSKTQRDQVFRREAVQKLYPKNGHKFYATQTYQVQLCAVCNEYIRGGAGYQCQNCNYLCHAKCYQNVITKCISLQDMKNAHQGEDLNTGQLLKYNIPHRFETKTNLVASFCCHCGCMSGPGQKINKCLECGKFAHRDCTPMVPHFCGLAPDTAQILIQAFEEHEKKMLQKQLEEAEQHERQRQVEELAIAAMPVQAGPAPPYEQIQADAEYAARLAMEEDQHRKRAADEERARQQQAAEEERRLREQRLAEEERKRRQQAAEDERKRQIQVAEEERRRKLMLAEEERRKQLLKAEEERKAAQQHLLSQKMAEDERRRLQERLVEEERNRQNQIQEEERKRQQMLLEEERRRQAQLAEEERKRQQQIAEEEKRRQQQLIEEERRRQQMKAEEERRKQMAIEEEKTRMLLLVEEERRRKAADEERRRKQVEDEMRRKKEEEDRRRMEEEAKKRARQSVPIPAGMQAKVSIDDFHFECVLGRGAFGKVMLAKEKQTGNYYAIKALKKEFIIQNDDVKSAKLEKRIFQIASQAHHPFLLNIHSAFQSESRIYFVMEYVSGGDLMCHIQEKKRFSQIRTKFYACEVLLALEYFHKNNIIYRDLKLDNILMTPDGHLKVADYGICKENMPYGATTRTYCGTPDYMAPEILNQNRYGRACDWWSFGVLIYVMLIGRYPFHGEDEADILDAILSDSIEYPSNMPKDTLSLLQGLMRKDPSRRLGGGKLDAEEVKRHPYFAGVDWDAFMAKSVQPPWKPQVTSATDVSNFDSEFTREDPVLTPLNSVLSAAAQAEFGDFDYVAEWVWETRFSLWSKYSLGMK
ncbi:Serine/threonine kinase [Chytridiales sp. JEL 0842]|nr:Serine/threonine kinase [Chytridiales sp. JEL 0842]